MNLNKMINRTLFVVLVLSAAPAWSDPFTTADLQRWQQEYDATLKKGDQVFHGGLGNENGVSCDQCHPNAANTHPETYPKFQQQLGKVAQLWEMINWCIMNPLESLPLEADDPKMTAIQTYITHERRGVKMAPGKH